MLRLSLCLVHGSCSVTCWVMFLVSERPGRHLGQALKFSRVTVQMEEAGECVGKRRVEATVILAVGWTWLDLTDEGGPSPKDAFSFEPWDVWGVQQG